MNLAVHLRRAIISLLLSVPVAGFICGVYICSDCGFNPFNYVLIGLMHAFLLVTLLGICFTGGDIGICFSGGDSGCSSTANLLPYVPLIFLALWVTMTAFGYVKTKLRKRAVRNI